MLGKCCKVNQTYSSLRLIYSYLVTLDYQCRYLGHFLPEDSEGLVSIARTWDGENYEYWNKTLGVWRQLHEDSFRERLVRIHDTYLEEHWGQRVFPKAFF